MQQTAITVSEDLFRQAKSKAIAKGVSLSEVVQGLLDRWIVEEAPDTARQELVEQATRAHGMWSDRDPDELLRESRQKLGDRDQDLADARLAAR